MLLILMLGAELMNLSPEMAATQDNEPILIEETGVARSYNATKNIRCGDVEWRTSWTSGPQRGSLSGTVTYVKAGKRKILPDAQAQLFGKLETLNELTATCNTRPDGSVRTALLVGGEGLENRAPSLVQVHVDESLKPSWSFNPVTK